MTPKQILDSFSDTLMQDERILSAQERSLVAILLRHAKAAAGENPEMQEAVRAVVAAAVGETVAQRAFSVLGESIVDRVLKSGGVSDSEAASSWNVQTRLSSSKELESHSARASKPRRDEPAPPVPKGEPAPPVPKEPAPPVPREPAPPVPREPEPPGVRTPRKPMKDTPTPAPGTKEPAPPIHGMHTTVMSAVSTGVAERPAVLKAKCCVLDEFLAPQELAVLTQFALDHENDFSASEVISPVAEGGVIDYEHRRSRVLMDLEEHQDMILQRIQTVLPRVLRELEMEDFDVAHMEAQITASNAGDFFHFHSDNSNDRVASRYLTFVYFFQREPRQFEGGELRLHDARLEDGIYVSEGSYQSIVPSRIRLSSFRVSCCMKSLG